MSQFTLNYDMSYISLLGFHVMDIETIKGIINTWANSKDLINKVWIFGSRAKGTYKPDSDLDLAFELDINYLSHGDSSGGWGTFMHESKAWEKELNKTIPFKLDLQLLDYESEKIKQYLKDFSILIYEKQT